MTNRSRVLTAKVAPRKMPTEHLILVGGPSNTFSGYLSWDSQTGNIIPQSPPRFLEDVPRYIGIAPQSADARKPETHDKFWGNFSYPVTRLFEKGVAKPLPGDLVTVMIHRPGIRLRDALDWAASPWNLRAWRNSPWVRGIAPYDPPPRGTPPRPKHYPSKRDYETQTMVSEARIDHEILMRERDPDPNLPPPKVCTFPKWEGQYTDILRSLPRQIVHGQTMMGKPRLPGVLVKLCWLEEKNELFDYLATGTWRGAQLRHPLDKQDPEEPGAQEAPEEILEDNHTANYDFYAVDAPKYAARFWQAMPSVDRGRVKIRRFDYFGHSGSDGFLLGYGLSNQKGQEPTVDCLVSTSDLVDAVRGREVFAANAFAKLWGCHLGESMARALAGGIIPRVCACEGPTIFDDIFSGDGFPTAAPGFDWKEYP